MIASKALISLFLAILVIGCKGFSTTKSGLLGEFILSKVGEYSGRKDALKSSKSVGGNWSYKEDEFGTVILSEDVSFEEIDEFIKVLYGTPNRAGTTPGEETQWAIPAKKSGAAIWYAKSGKGIIVTITRPIK